MEKILSCNNCCAEKNSKVSSSIEKWILVRCSDCGLVYLNPRPQESEMSQYYEKDYERHWILSNYLKSDNKLVNP